MFSFTTFNPLASRMFARVIVYTFLPNAGNSITPTTLAKPIAKEQQKQQQLLPAIQAATTSMVEISKSIVSTTLNIAVMSAAITYVLLSSIGSDSSTSEPCDDEIRRQNIALIHEQQQQGGTRGVRKYLLSVGELDGVSRLVGSSAESRCTVMDRCAICLDDEKEEAREDLLRVLVCGHAFHAPCIDLWLTTPLEIKTGGREENLKPILNFDEFDPLHELLDTRSVVRLAVSHFPIPSLDMLRANQIMDVFEELGASDPAVDSPQQQIMAEEDTPVVVPATRPAELDRCFGDAPSKRQKVDEKAPQKLPDSAPAVQPVAVTASVASVALPGPASKIHPQQTVSSTPKSVQKQFVAPVVKLAQQKPTAAAAAAPAPVTVVSGTTLPNLMSVAQSATPPLIHAPKSVQPQQTLTKPAAPIPKVVQKQLAVAAATETTIESAICVKLEPAGVVLKSAEKQSQNTKPEPVFQQQRQQQSKAMAPVPQPPATNLVQQKLVLPAPKVVRPPAPKPKPVTTAVPLPAPAPALAVTTKSFSAPSGSQPAPVHASVQRPPPPPSLEVRRQNRAPAPLQMNALPVLAPLAVSPSSEVLSTRPVSHTTPSPVSHSPKSQAAFQEQVQRLQLPSKSTSSALAPPVQRPQVPHNRPQRQTQGHRPELQISALMSPPMQQTSEPVVRQQLQNRSTEYMDSTPEPVAVPAAVPTAALIPNPSHSAAPLVGHLLSLTQQGLQDLSISQHHPQMQPAPPVAATPRPPSPMHTDAALMAGEPILTTVSEESDYDNGVASFRASAHDMLEQIKTMADIMLCLSRAGIAGAAGNAMGNLDVAAFNQRAKRAATLAKALFGPVASGGSSSSGTGAVTDSTTVKVNPEPMQ
ncbi:hypothetical protein LPJ66_007286 [Kickxella alabastrina]|uniref:Uncharacterized protein n=1 Tax=Kickxella alabastrina TaxID=61397 RepID=A0ACC1I9D4_9FUNG|nr:hypothetical protein LPJ66_007286 [Kickxella alabastrina]